MLTIQRTLCRGWRHGFITGLGAMLSDLIYGVVTLVGVSFVADFFDKYESYIQTLGSIILFCFGYFVFSSNPLKGLTPNKFPQETRYVKDFVSSFLLTLSNVSIILVFMGLYAHFSFNPWADDKRFFAAGLIAIAAAIFIWWFFLTTLVFQFRRHFNRRGLLLLNRSVGAILMLMGAGEILLTLFSDFDYF